MFHCKEFQHSSQQILGGENDNKQENDRLFSKSVLVNHESGGWQ